MSIGNRRNTALIDFSAPDLYFGGVPPIERQRSFDLPWEGFSTLFGRSNYGVTALNTGGFSPEGRIGVPAPWNPVLLPTSPHPKYGGGPSLTFPLLLANPVRSRAPQPKAGLNFTFDFGSLQLGAGGGQ